METDLLKTCPICNSNECNDLKRIHKTYLSPFDKTYTSKYKYCSFCDFTYCENPLSNKALKYYYEHNDQLRRNELKVPEIKHMEGQIEFILKYFDNKKTPNVLEIGADNGNFLLLFSAKKQMNSYFDELNPNAITLLEEKGFINSLNINAPKRYDLIVLRHVFEHIPNPLNFLNLTLKDKLNKKGYIFIEIPDYTHVDSIWSDIFQFEHVNYFSLTSIHSLVKKSNFIIHSIEFAQTKEYSTTPNRVMRILLQKTDKKHTNTISKWNQLIDNQYKMLDRFFTFAKQYQSKRIALYSAGTYTITLLTNASTDFKVGNIYDIDSKKQGKLLFGYTVQSPSDLKNDSYDLVMIMSSGYEEEIRSYLINNGISKHKIHAISEFI